MERIFRSGILFAGSLLRGALQATFKPKHIKKTLPLFVTMSLVVSTMLPAGLGIAIPRAYADTASMSPVGN